MLLGSYMMLGLVVGSMAALIRWLAGIHLDAQPLVLVLSSLLALAPALSFADMHWRNRGREGQARRSVVIDLEAGVVTIRDGEEVRHIALSEVQALRLDEHRHAASLAVVCDHGEEHAWGPSAAPEPMRAAAWELAQAMQRPLQWHDHRQ